MNSKPTISRTVILWSVVALLIITGTVTLVYSLRGNQSDTTTDLDTAINIAYTNAMSTVLAQQLTQQASTSTATLTLAAPALPTFTFTPFPIIPPAPISTSTSAVPTVGCDSSVYLADVTIPDGTTVTAGQTFTKTWKVSNTGTCTWSATYQIILIAGEGMSGKATPIGKIVKPGETAEVSVVLIAPSTTGAIKGTWRLSNDKSQPFGTVLTVEIKVGTAVTATPTATATPTTVAYPNP